VEIVKPVILGLTDGVGKELFDVLGDPAEGVGIRRIHALHTRDVPLEVLEIEGVDDVDAPGEICGLNVRLDATVRAGGPGGGGELTGLVGGEVELEGGGRETEGESLGGDVGWVDAGTENAEDGYRG